MSMTQLNPELRELVSMVKAEDDPQEASRRLAERITRIRAKGEVIPAEIERLERQLKAECIATSQGR